ncbi:NACHT domain-containing protein [Nonomuraea jiangxiensis]|uniref:NACHT domain-containing protein n=1 Tax=Nonomuraea jiangxiensis TaxID=633440 RepID=UPI000B8154C7|nr:NACHT domain-containing protein [Nonomuraea jiangxiensis]
MALIALVALSALVAGNLDPSQEVDSADAAQVLLAVAVVAVPLVLWMRRPAVEVPVPDAKAALRELVRAQWREEAAARSLNDPGPIPLDWYAHGRPVGDPVAWFRTLNPRRMVITGGAGTGKTTLAVQLLLGLIETAQEGEPVPVILPLTEWDLSRWPHLSGWLADRLAAHYPGLRSPQYGDDAPAWLARGGHLLPVLDGLDELPAAARSEVITRLNSGLGDGDQVILTCRRPEYDAAVRQAGRMLTGAAVIVPKAVTPRVAADYLRSSLPNGEERGWLDTLRSGKSPALAAVAATPLGLWLLRTVHAEHDPDPRITEAELWHHLLDHVVPATMAARPPAGGRSRTPPGHDTPARPGGAPAGDRRSSPDPPFRPHHRWSPEAATKWLRTLACQPDVTWWRIASRLTTPAERRLLPFAAGVVLAVLTAGPLVAAGALSRMTFGTAELWLLGTTGVALPLIFARAAHTWLADSPGTVTLRRHLMRRPEVPALRAGLVTGLAIGLPIGLGSLESSTPVVSLLTGIVSAVAAGLPLGTAVWLVQWLEHPAPDLSAVTPPSSWRSDRALTLARALGSLSMVIPLSLLLTAVGDSQQRVPLAFALAWLAAIVFGLLFGRHHAWAVCVIVLCRLALTGRLPFRLMPFLDDMHRLGILRAVGPIYQFRHERLRAHLSGQERP